MFNQELNNRVSSLEWDLRALHSKFAELQYKHYRLLEALGLQEVAHPAITELVKKTGEAQRGEK